MSLETATRPTDEEIYIPGDDEVTVETGGPKSYRFAKGQIVTGRSEDGNLVVREKIIGVVVRIGIHEGRTNDQYKKPYKQVEAEIRTRAGTVGLHVGLLDENYELRPTQAALTFGWCLTQVAQSGVFVFTAAAGEAWVTQDGKAREASTYANIAVIDDKNVAKAIYRPKADRNAPKRSAIEKWAEIEAQLRAHPLFAARPAKEGKDSGVSHLGELSKECETKGWPTPEQAPVEWLTGIAGFYQHQVRGSLADYNDDQWGELRLALQDLKDLPAVLEPAAARLKKGPAGFGAAAPKDPFAKKAA